MTLPKGFGSAGGEGNMTGLITLSAIAAWLATFGGTAAGYFYYPWAYPTNSGHYAFIVLSVIIGLGYIFCIKVAEEGTRKNSNALVTAVISGMVVGTILISMYVGF